MNTYLKEVRVKTAPTTEPIVLADCKAWMKIKTGFTDDDTLINNTLIPSARRAAEKFLNRSLITQTLEAYYQVYGEKVILPYSPVQSVDVVTRVYLDTSTILTVNSDYYTQGLDDKWLIMANPLTFLKAGYSPTDKFNIYELKVEFKAGYGDATKVPAGIKEALYMLVAEHYNNRTLTTESGANEISEGARKKLMQYKYFAI